jgi:RNA recognition motif-containing protein
MTFSVVGFAPSSARGREVKEVFFMSSNKLYVGNLNYKTTEEKLKELFSQYGEVISVNILPGRGFGFVEMAAAESAQEARDKLNGSDFEGRKIIVNDARPRTERRDDRRGFGEKKGFRRY